MVLDVTPRAVVFDLDGLMFNTEDLYDEVGEQLLLRRGRQFDAALKRKMMGLPGLVSLQVMIDHHQLRDDAAQLQAESDAIFAEILPGRLRPLHGLPELLDALEAAGIPKAIATSSHRPFTETVLSQAGYRDRFAFLLTSENVVRGKPHPEIYLTACARFGLSPPQILVLEDSENGCRAAVAAGVFAVAVPGRHSCDHDFTGARLVAESLADPRIYGALGLSSPT
jgi:HAD superfamily hydrolase (TIGR01509 family)